MSKLFEVVDRGAVDHGIPGEELWDTIVQFAIEWFNATRSPDHDAAARVEQELRPLVLAFASLTPDATVTTGRKAVLRSLYAKLGETDTRPVVAMLSCVIAREQAAARRCSGGGRENG